MSILILDTLVISPGNGNSGPYSLPNGHVGVLYLETLTCTGIAPLAWTISSGTLPTGLTLNSLTGIITGIPTVEGLFNFTVHVVDLLGSSANQQYD